MIKCNGCGAYIKPDQAVKKEESWDTNCIRCVKCIDNAELRETYCQGFNDGLDAAAEALQVTVMKSRLRKSELDDENEEHFHAYHKDA